MRRKVVANRVAPLSIAILVALVALTISGVIAATASGTETRSLTSSADTKIVENAPTENHGAASSLGVNGNVPSGSGKDKSALLTWDLSTIPAGSKISSASITLNVTKTSTQTYQAYELKRPWVESAATWLLYAAAKSWQIAGANGSLDRGTTVVGSVSPSTTGKQTFVLSPAVVQSWVDNPASNNGIIIASATNTDAFAFSSRETSTSSLRPQLTLNLSLETTPPETTIDSRPSGTVSTSSTSFAFSSSEPNSTFECSLDSGAFASCSSPKSYSGLSEGSHTFQVRAKDATNNVDPTPASYTWMVDTVAPNVSIDSGPSGAVSGTSASFTFSSNDQGATFQCSLDGDAFEACSSQKEYTDLTEGSHTFSVKSTDAAGNTDPIPASTTWTVDAVAPDTTIDSGPSGTTIVAEATFAFSSEAGATFECRLDGAAYSACTSPKSYTNLSNGSHTFDVRATDGADNVNATPASRTFSVEVPPPPDTTAPETTIDSGPSGTVSTSSASFTFSSNDQGATFQCSLDGDAFEACSSPKEYTDLPEGSHTFSVKSTDAAGNTDASPASTTWTMDTTAPETKIDSNPNALTNSASASFDFSSPEPGSSFQCKLDSGTYEACTLPKSLTGLSDGSHTFSVKATDAASNTDLTPADFTWTVDTTPPETTIDAKPNDPSNNASPSFEFSSNEANSTFECSLDGGNFEACTLPKSLSTLSDGSHTFSVRDTDAAGNTDASPASTTWTVDTTSPETTIDTGPADGATLSSGDVSFTFSSDEAGSTFQCQLDPLESVPASCTSPKAYSGLMAGIEYTFSVWASDASGNTDATPSTQSFTVDATAPAAPTITSGLADASTDTDGDFSFAFTGAEAGGTYQCSLDTGTASYSSCTSPKSYTGQANGSYTFRVRQVDAVGNVGAATTRSFSVVLPVSDNCPNEAGPASIGGCPIPNPYPGLRFHQLVGYQPDAGMNVTGSYVDSKYNQLMKPAYHGPNKEVKFTIRNNLRWTDVLDNPNLTPTHAQMRDHNWSGYTWDTTDEIAQMYNAQCVRDGRCKVSLQIQVSAGAGGETTPQFMLNEDLAWLGESQKPRIKFYKPEARAYVTEFYLAILDRYADDDRIGSVKLAEYYPGNQHPADFDRAAFESGYETVLRTTIAGAPKDANGERAVILQSNPVMSAGRLECSDFVELKVGVASADPRMFTEPDEARNCAAALHGVAPQSIPGDAPYHRSGRNFTWDGTPNPWGYQQGQSVQITLPQVAWFYGHKGVMPMDQEFVVKGNLDSQFQTAMDQFGPNGTRVAQWGGIPFAE